MYHFSLFFLFITSCTLLCLTMALRHVWWCVYNCSFTQRRRYSKSASISSSSVWAKGEKRTELWRIHTYWTAQCQLTVFLAVISSFTTPFKAVNVWSWTLPNIYSCICCNRIWGLRRPLLYQPSYPTAALFKTALTMMLGWCSEW